MAAVWACILSVALNCAITHRKAYALETGKEQTHAAIEKDFANRHWAAVHGGLCVPVTDHTQPNPYLSQVPEGDIETSSGKRLTIMAPSYMTRQAYESALDRYGLLAAADSGSRAFASVITAIWAAGLLGLFLIHRVIDRGVDPENEAAKRAFDSEEMLRVLINADPDIVCFKDGEGRWIEANDAILELFRLKGVDFRGRRDSELADFTDPIYREAFLACERTDEAAWKKGGISRSDEEIPLPGGGRRYYNFIKVPLFNPDGSRKGLVVLARDVTERKAAEEGLKVSLNRLEMALFAADLGHWDWNVRTGDVHFSDQWARMLGYDPAEIEPTLKAWEGLIHPDDRAGVIEALSAHLEGRTPFYETEYRLLTKTGGWKWILDRGKVMDEDESGKPIRVVGIYQDITKRKEMEQKCDEVARFLRGVLDGIQDGIVVLDPELNILMTNRAVKHWHADRMPFFGKKCHEVFQMRTEPCPRCPSIEAMRDSEPRHESLAVIDARGEKKFIELLAYPIIKESGKVDGVIEIVRDVTREKILEAQLQHAQKMEAVGILAGGVAHDFNNILAAIHGYAELSLLHLDPASPLYPKLTQIIQAAEKAAGIVRQLLLFSRRQPMELVTVDLNGIVTDLLKMLDRLIGEDIAIRTELEPGPLYIEADPGNIGQVIMNLAVNARDAMPEGGTIAIRTESVETDEAYCNKYPLARPGSFVRFSISDTGTGMDEENFSHIFEPFFTTKCIGKGTGLGLSVAYGIVKSHNGWITVESAPGKGTTIDVFLPLVAGQKAAVDKGWKSVPSVPEDRRETILVVEDEKHVREFLEEVLTEAGYLVLKAGTAEEAARIFEKEAERVGLILSDVVLPDISGLKLVDGLLSMRPGIPVVMCSGYTNERSKRTIILERGWVFLEKPYSINALLRTVKDAVGKTQQDALGQDSGCNPA